MAHSARGRYIARFPVRDGRTLFFLLCRDDDLPKTATTSGAERKAAIAHAVADMGWECPAILSALDHVDGIHFDSISHVRMDTWCKGRVALVGDAAACPSLIAGTGAGFALAEAYVLAGEIHAHPHDPSTALERYQLRLQAFIARKQTYAERMVPSFIPKTAAGVRARDFATLLMRLPVFPRLLMGRYLHDEMQLPDYAI